jgi:transposase
MDFVMTNESEARTCFPEKSVMSGLPPTTIVDSSKRCSTATGPEFRGATCPSGSATGRTRTGGFSRWAKKGTWQRLFEHLAADVDNEYAMIDSTIVRAHQHSTGAPQKR